jgi:hypothetical protein
MKMIKRLVSLAATIGGTIFAMVLASDVAWAEKRVALIVGNSTYQTVPQLPNPSRDASSVAKMFRDAGFDAVDVQLNVGNLEFKRSIRKFEAMADQADIAVVYYAGHGLEIAGTNYLIPIDARLASDRDADDEAILLERLVASADGAKRLRLVILDACRDNPFVGTMRRERKTANRAVTAGLGKVEPTSTDTLIAYAAKAGSTADDGDGLHSPFTTAVLKNLTVPGLDVRLAFGRVRDEVMKVTGNRQEPFVYGSLGGGNISLVPAPAVPQETSVSDVKADYELVQKIGSRRAWEVFLRAYPTGFYADLARGQMESLNNNGNVNLASLPQPAAPSSRETSSREALEWDKVKDSTDPAVLQKFIKRFPDSPLSINAQQRMDVLNQAAQEREDKARAERETARRAAEEALRQAEQRKAELAAAKKREDDERRAREAEAAEKARAAAAELAAAKKREDEERRAKAAEAEQKAKAAEAERKAAEAKQKAEEAEKNKAAAEAAALRVASEKQAREAEAQRKKAELAAAQEAACKQEQAKLEELAAKGSEGSGIEALKSFSAIVTCGRLGPLVVATLDRFKAEAAARAATLPNSPELVRSAQTQLIRLGCLTGKADGAFSAPTKSALGRYLSIEGQPSKDPSVTEQLVTELNKRTSRVCPLECKTNETLKGETCVADEKPAAPAPATASRKNDDDDTPARRKQSSRQPEREKPRAKPVPDAPRARQQAVARPSIVSGGGGSHTMIGVGF